MIRARITFEGEEAGAAAGALRPDNPEWIEMTQSKGAVSVEFSAERAGTILATVDDLLMNAKVAEETYGLLRRMNEISP